MSLSIIIPSKNVTNLCACISAIRRAGDMDRIIVIDDGLDTPTPTIPSDWPPFSRIYGQQPFIFARNINAGIKACDGDVVLINDDAILQPGPGLHYLGLTAEAQTQYGVMSAAIVGYKNPLLPAAPRQTRDAGRTVPFVCVYIRREVIDRVGLLDERFTGTIDGYEVYGGEDDDYCYRVRQAGWKIGVCDGCVVDHNCLPSTFRSDASGQYFGARLRFKQIHGMELYKT